MAIEVFNRHECKYLIDSAVFEEISKKLTKYMNIDDYNKIHDLYTISNIYYDTKDNHLIRTSLSKPYYKEKLRIRGYGIPKKNEKVYLEIKKKVCNVVNKRRTKISLTEAYEFIATGEKPLIKDYMNKQVINEIQYILKTYNLEPKLYLAYDRKAFFSKDNRDLRITFDTNIRTRRYDLTLEAGDYGENLLDEGKWLMEVKAEKNIPFWLATLLSEYKIFKVSFSKYGREYEKLLQNERKLRGEMNLCLNQYQQAYSPQLQLTQQYL